MSTRTEQVGSVIQREVSQLFSEAMDESDYGLITVLRVDVLADLSEARIYVSALKNGRQLIELLEKRRGFIRRTVSPRLYLKTIPKFRFFLDTTGADAERIEMLLKR